MSDKSFFKVFGVIVVLNIALWGFFIFAVIAILKHFGIV